MYKPITETSLLDMLDGTELKFQVRKPHAGCVQIVAVTSSDQFKVLFDYKLNSQVLIDKNMVNENLKPLPTDWPIDHDIYKEPIRSAEDLARYK